MPNIFYMDNELLPMQQILSPHVKDDRPYYIECDRFVFNISPCNTSTSYTFYARVFPTFVPILPIEQQDGVALCLHREDDWAVQEVLHHGNVCIEKQYYFYEGKFVYSTVSSKILEVCL